MPEPDRPALRRARIHELARLLAQLAGPMEDAERWYLLKRAAACLGKLEALAD
jgi:ABC-type hemin transport system ATPase subunit